MQLSTHVIFALISLGAMEIKETNITIPQTEEEFLHIQYEPSSLNISWNNYQIKFQERIQEIQKRLLRNHRDYLLSKSDWIMTADVFPTIANKEDWIVYRQALRDLPNTVAEYIWRDNRYEALDFKRMNIPQTPPVLRT